MSYKLEVTGPELSSTLRGTLAAWASQEHDLHLVTREGYRVFTHRALLALHSRHLRRVLLDAPVCTPLLLFRPSLDHSTGLLGGHVTNLNTKWTLLCLRI